MFMYLFSNVDYSSGNAVGVVANSLDEAKEIASKHIKGFEFEDKHTQIEEREIEHGLVFYGVGYYRPELTFG